eukprot:CAMPEP_0115302876 /NCGR_PEP_ID=MMETSP0270-20121206/70616_1 /TAXON_ID=71861 /ORGANISM="Scrippsiella trochoidea, Strain CCMP3099" /LENGTH=248 /DNA_ID=CAMNT_0002720831 /DNA_START=61 /DNA_END=803 /DNA_ORIENTATION=-
MAPSISGAGASPARAAEDPTPSLLALSKVTRTPNWTFPKKPAPDPDSLVPGPGAYRVPSTDATSRHSRGPGFSFGTSGREVVGNSKMPGPGSYSTTKNTFRETLAYSMSPRRQPKKAEEELPGPGAHSISSCFGDGPKFSALGKIPGSLAAQAPGPGEYDVAGNEATATRSPRCCFGGARAPDPPGVSAATPGPGAYTLSASEKRGPSFSIKARLRQPRPEVTPGPGAHGGHYTSFGDYHPGVANAPS